VPDGRRLAGFDAVRERTPGDGGKLESAGKNIGASASGFIRHYFPEYIPKIDPVKNEG